MKNGNFALVAFLTLNSLGLSAFARTSTLSPRSRESIMKYAYTAEGTPYNWGSTSWDPKNKKAKGPDCSGLILKAWAWPSLMDTTVQLKAGKTYPLNGHGKQVLGRLTTWELKNAPKAGLPFKTETDFAKAEMADTFVRSKLVTKKNKKGEKVTSVAGHIVFMVSKLEKGSWKIFHAPRTGQKIQFGTYDLSYLKARGFIVLKRDNVLKLSANK